VRVVARTWCCAFCLVTVWRVLLWYYLRWMRSSCRSRHASLSRIGSRSRSERVRWCCMALQSSAAHLAQYCWCCATYDGRMPTRSSPKPATSTLVKIQKLTAALLSRLASYLRGSVASCRPRASASHRCLAAGRHGQRCVHWRLTLVSILRRAASPLN
jgi:hypothetical protein